MPANDSDATPPDDDLKRKYREALVRKQAKGSVGAKGDSEAGSSIQDAHGPASSKRTFRRRSGSS